MTAGLVTLLVAACLGVVWLITCWVNGMAHPRGQHHGLYTPHEPTWADQALTDCIRRARAERDGEIPPLPRGWDACREPVIPAAIWGAPVHLLVPDVEVARRRAQVAAAVERGKVVASLQPSPWGDDTGSFKAITARDLGTPGGAP